jgi:proteasome accessory factor A
LFEWVQFNRAIINTRDEPLADARKYRRLHLLHGDTSVLPTTLLLKIGSTSLALDLLEIDHMP